MTRTMRPLRFASFLVILLAFASAVTAAQDFGVKQLQGKVLNASGATISSAIVYLENSRNNDIKSYITESDGSYHFANLSADTDYSVWASYKGKKSSTRTVSSFDTKKNVYLDLHIKE